MKVVVRGTEAVQEARQMALRREVYLVNGELVCIDMLNQEEL